jgi:hypothetical protein
MILFSYQIYKDGDHIDNIESEIIIEMVRNSVTKYCNDITEEKMYGGNYM